jgi:hypothetical protein
MEDNFPQPNSMITFVENIPVAIPTLTSIEVMLDSDARCRIEPNVG